MNRDPNVPFDLLRWKEPGPVADSNSVLRRSVGAQDASFVDDAPLFVPGEELATSINAALAVGEPLLITGEPGTGKTQAAYYAAWKLGLGEVEHFQVKSDTTAHDLLYHFDAVRYFRDAQRPGGAKPQRKSGYVEPRALWRAMNRARQGKPPKPVVLLIDEVDKAPRDFPNDLLHELDKMEFTVLETGARVTVPKPLRPIVFITSNSERRLPEPFLRRCVYHHIRFDPELLRKAVEVRRSRFDPLDDDLVELAIVRFMAIRGRSLRKLPATAEFLMWLRVLSAAFGTKPRELHERLTESESGSKETLPFLGVLLKDRQDLEELRTT